jgi:peptidoglycan/LPS O-acetylase OafA/YrhL
MPISERQDHPAQVTPRFDTPRFETLDVLRGLSILSVVLLHSWIRFRGEDQQLHLPISRDLFNLIFRNGDNGVTIFFAVSGFLIAFTSIKRFGSLAAIEAARFYRIRFARIAPLLLLILAILSALHLAHVDGFIISPRQTTLPRALFAALTFHLNWLEGKVGYLPANWDVLWSLSVEEMFYLFFPIACLLLLRWKRGLLAFIALLLAFVAMGPFARTIWTDYAPIWQEKSYLGGMDAIALGCLTALLTQHLLKRARPHRALLIAIEVLGAALIFLILYWPHWPFMKFIGRTGLDGSILPLGACLVMLASVLLHQKGSIFTAPIRWFGRHSYEVYMTHEFLVILGVQLFLKLNAQHHAGPLLLWFAGILLLTAPLGWLVARFFSEPLNRRLRPHRSLS